MLRRLKLPFFRLRKRLSPKNGVSDALQVLEGSAENEVSDMERNVREMAQHIKVPSEATAWAAKVINGVDGVLKLVSAIASTHPILNMVVKAVVKVVELEKQRHENDAHIIKVHCEMVTTVYHLKALRQITADAEDDLKTHLGETFHKMANTIKEFGSFVDLYHRYWQKIFKLLFASHHRQKLQNFITDFEEHKRQFDRVVQTRFATKSLQQLDSIQATTQQIMEHLSVFEDGLAGAQNFIRKHGADAIINDDEHLQQLANMLGERLTDNMKRTLREDFDVLLRENTERFEMKLQSVERNVLASMDAARGEIMRQLNAGPHEAIQDELIQKIWKDNDWKSTVKCSEFVEALREHYQKEFNSYNVSYNGDAWTVEFFSRIIYHSAIGDIVDEDGSGSITVSEMNAFCNPKQGRRPSNWTIAQWFAFCASGWYNNNKWYYHRVKRSLKQIDQELHTRVRGDQRRHVEKILKSLKPLLWIEDIEDDDNLEKSLNPNISYHLRQLQETYRAEEIQNITSRLGTFDYYLEDQSAVAAIMGDTRVELHVMCALHILVDKLKQHNNRGEFYSIEQVATSCMVVYLAFEARMHTLMRGWRSQGRDIELQLGRYADGLFQNFHREAPKRKKALDDLCQTLFKSTPPRFRSMIESASHAPHTQMDELTQKVTTLTERFDNLEHNLSVQDVVPASGPSRRIQKDTPLGDEESDSSDDDSSLWDAYLDRGQSWLQSLTSAARRVSWMA